MRPPMRTEAKLSRLVLPSKILPRIVLGICSLFFALTIGCGEPPTSPRASAGKPQLLVSHAPFGSVTVPSQLVDIARFFAPVIYQYVGTEPKYDFLAKITFDGDWDAENNWENAASYPKPGIVYTSIIEDLNRYFIHYGTYHPRDLCNPDGGFTAQWFIFNECPWASGFHNEHENDMEGVTIVVEKRFSTPSWPFGQIITAQTIYHNSYPLYKNCDLEGYPLYVTTSSWEGAQCMTFRSGTPGTTSPNAQKRFEAYVDYGGHAVWLGQGHTIWPGSDIGIVEYVASNSVGDEPVVTHPYTNATYSLQFITDPELDGESLWDQRGKSNGPLTSQEFVFPPGAYLLTHFKGTLRVWNLPPVSTPTAKVPWGQSGDAEQLGIWHNDPARYWSMRFRPYGPASTQYYDYCYGSSCQVTFSYLYNPYWPAAQPSVPGPFQVSINGPMTVGPNNSQCGVWTAVLAGTHTPPAQYTWFGLFESTETGVSGAVPSSGGELFVHVVDASGAHASAALQITYDPNNLNYCE